MEPIFNCSLLYRHSKIVLEYTDGTGTLTLLLVAVVVVVIRTTINFYINFLQVLYSLHISAAHLGNIAIFCKQNCNIVMQHFNIDCKLLQGIAITLVSCRSNFSLVFNVLSQL